MMSAARHREIERIESGYTQSLLSVDNYIKRYINLAQVLKADSFLTNYLNKHYPQDTTLEKRSFDHISIMQTYTSRLLYETLNGNSVSVITDNQELLLMANSFISHCPPEIEAASWYQKSVQKLAEMLYVNPSYLGQYFKKMSGTTINEYVNRKRIDWIKQHIRKSDVFVQKIITDAGYNNSGYFYRVFQKQEGISFADYRKALEQPAQDRQRD